MDYQEKERIARLGYGGYSPFHQGGLARSYDKVGGDPVYPSEEEPVTNPLERQVGGNHYKSLAIQPIEYILSNGLGFAEGNIIKYTTRYKQKGGVEDLKKVIHYAELLIAHHEKEGL